MYNDEYLLSMVHEKSEEAEEILFDKYKKMIYYKAMKYRYSGTKLGLEMDDLIQEGMIGLSQAIEGYSNHKNVLFTTFANLCVEREIQTAILKASRKKHSLLNESVSIDKKIDDDKSFIELIESKELSAEDQVMKKIFEEADVEMVQNELTKFEREVFVLKYQGFEYREIADVLDKTPKSVDNALQRIKRKVKHLFD